MELLVRGEVVDGLGGRDVGDVDNREGRCRSGVGVLMREVLKGIVGDEVDEGGEVRVHVCVWDISKQPMLLCRVDCSTMGND